MSGGWLQNRRSLVGGPFFMVLLVAAILWLRASPFQVASEPPREAPPDLAELASQEGMAVVACQVDRWFEEDPLGMEAGQPPFEPVAAPRFAEGWVFAVVPAGSGSAALLAEHLPGRIRFRWTEIRAGGFGHCDDFGTVYDGTAAQP